ncbi:DUF932 domain-containing protein [Actinoplanes sp. NPDC051859]|uniref:DUF932 domain-containing protein n=1 Tax=Actinoplanes sp. NPDC051859 TaxID=3363909 RepID=UPI00378D3F23
MVQPSLAVAANRHVSMETLVAALQDQKARAVDIIAGTAKMRCVDGQLVFNGVHQEISLDGVTTTDGRYTLSDTATRGVADKLDIDVKYLRRCSVENLPAFDYNINTWLERDDRRFLARCMRHETSAGDGFVRAFLSDRFLRMDNLDTLLAALRGIREAGVSVEVESCDLTEQRMYVRFVSPDVQVLAPDLLRDYRSPFDGRRGSDLPVISGGFIFRNSETGFGRYSIGPYLKVQVCRNGMALDRGVLGRTHVGAQIVDDDGIIEPSAQTVRRELDLVESMTTDAVRTYLSSDFVARAVRDLEKAAGVVVAKPDETIKIVSQKLRFTQEQQADILNFFIAGSDRTAGGVMQAVTAFARATSDADLAFRLERNAEKVLRLAATAAA